MRNQTILVDINKETCKILKYKQYDNNNILQIIVEENYKKINLNEYVGFAFFELPSGLIIKKKCEIEDNVITIIIDNNVLSEEGKVLLDLTLSDGEDIFTLFRINLVIEETIDRDEAIIIEAGWDIVAEIAKFDKAEEQRVANEERRVDYESVRIANEADRQNEEAKRTANENVRVAKESERLINELGRVDAEELRIENEELRHTEENKRLINEQGRVNAENIRAEFYEGFNDRLDVVDSQLAQKMNVGESITIGQIDKNKGKIDQTFLTDELLKQIAGTSGVYSTVRDFSLSSRKVDFHVLEGISNGNLYNKNWTIDGFYINENTGELIENNEFFTTDFIKVKPNTIYSINSTNRYCFFNSEGGYISGAIGNGSLTFTTPNDAYYFKTCNVLTSKHIVSLVEGENIISLPNYEVFLNPKSIVDNSIGKEKLNFETLTLMEGKNLFNKDTAIENTYIFYKDGKLLSAEGFYSSDYIKVSPNTTYTKNDAQQLAFYNIDKVYIGGLVNPVNTFTTPENAEYIRVTLQGFNIDTLQIELGNETTEYENFSLKVNPKNLPKNNHKNIVVVAKENGDYSSINEALSKIKDTKDNPVTIKLCPGVYVESVNTIQRYVSIIGENKDTCIIKTFTNDYYNPPLDCSANNYFANLTVIADDDGKTTPSEGVNNMPAYALHFDISGRYNKDLEVNQGESRFNNVIFISKHQHAAGIGISHNQHLIFENCEFISFDNTAFRAHNYQLAGAINQQMTVKNCIMRNNSSFAPIALQDPNTNSGANDSKDTVFTFINNVAYNENGKNNCLTRHVPLADGCVAGYIQLGVGSFGNSIEELNR